MNNNKNFFRNKCKTIRAGLNTDFYSKKITDHIRCWDIYKKSKNIMLFYPIDTECSLLDLLNDSSKKFYFPSIEKDDIFCRLYDVQKGFIKGTFGIPEPNSVNILQAGFLDLIFVPALAVDKEGYRLGYGKGFYDKFLTSYPNITTAVPISKELIFGEVPKEQHDVPIKYTICENGITKNITYEILDD